MLIDTSKVAAPIARWISRNSAILLAVFVLIGVPVETWLIRSQPPPPSSRDLYGPPETQAQSNQRDTGRGTDASPVVVEIKAQNGEKEAAQAEAKEFRDSATQWGVLGLTGILSVATILQFCALVWQGGLIKRSVVVAESALTHLERPFVYAKVDHAGLAIKESRTGIGRTIERSIFHFHVVNHGKTPAILTRVHYKFSVAPRGEFPDAIDPMELGGREIPSGIVAVKDAPYIETTDFRRYFMDEEPDVIINSVAIWITGFIRYADIFHVQRIIGFAHIFDTSRQQFVAHGGVAYNYAHDEDARKNPPPEDPL